jgi:hypothetical protein
MKMPIEKSRTLGSLNKKGRKIKDILITVNSTGPDFGKYPIGNKELTSEIKNLEQEGKIKFNSYTGLWEK